MSVSYQCSICNNCKNRDDFSRNQLNKKQNQKCKECINQSQLQKIDDNQKVLFEGYMRLRISKQAPMDIINICFMFYQIKLQKIPIIPSPHKKYKEHLLSLANEYLDNEDYYMAYQLAKYIEQTDPFNNGYCHTIIGKCLLKWGRYKKAEHAFAKSIEINNASGYKKVSPGVLATRHSLHREALQAQKKHHSASDQFEQAFNLSNRSNYAYEIDMCDQKFKNNHLAAFLNNHDLDGSY